jgi:hypothetical protein
VAPPITPAQYLADCKRRFGAANPERIDSSVWEWMIRARQNPYTARKTLGLPHNYDQPRRPYPQNPDWCFERMGAARIKMPDGRRITIAGEHEDSYDPDFCIYNDVIVQRADDIDIFAYPKDLFPPTDFHTATLIDDRIILIGALGYQGERAGPITPAFALDTNTYRIKPLITTGAQPGWIHRHTARLADNAIEIVGGHLLTLCNNEEHWADNLEEFRLDLRTLQWTQTTDHSAWRQFAVDYTEDISPGCHTDLRWYDGEILLELGHPCDLFEDPDLPEDPDDFEYDPFETPEPPDRTHIVHAHGVPILITDDYRQIRIQVRGRLDPQPLNDLLQHLVKLANDTGKKVEQLREL